MRPYAVCFERQMRFRRRLFGAVLEYDCISSVGLTGDEGFAVPIERSDVKAIDIAFLRMNDD